MSTVLGRFILAGSTTSASDSQQVVGMTFGQLRRIKAEQDARIAELTEQLSLSLSDRLLVAEMRAKDKLATEVADLKSKLDFANAMNADQDKTVAELTAEVASLRVAVTQGYEEGFKAGVKYQAADDATGLDYWTSWNKSIARNALKDGV